MRFGTTRQKRGAPMRQEAQGFWTRDSRRRFSPTENGHAALYPTVDVTRAYQSDSSSKQPSLSADLSLQVSQRAPPACLLLDRSVHIRGRPICLPPDVSAQWIRASSIRAHTQVRPYVPPQSQRIRL